MRNVSIVGAGMIRFGKLPDRSIEEMGAEACLNALRHAGMNMINSMREKNLCDAIVCIPGSTQRIFLI